MKEALLSFLSSFITVLTTTVSIQHYVDKSDSRLSKHWPQLLAETIFLIDLLNKQMVRYSDDTTLLAESKGELQRLLISERRD